jgi:hypothetical protein
MKRIFISHKHSDSNYVKAINDINKNPENNLMFCNKSLPEPIYNEYNYVNRRPPHDPASKPVKKAISTLLNTSDKLLILIGKDTHSSLWVDWEVQAFCSKHGKKQIRLMRIKNNTTASLPKNINAIKDLPIHNWNLKELTEWAKK